MVIAFATKRLRDICEDGAVAVKELGSPVAEALQERLADLRAAASIDDLIVGSPRVSGADSSTLTIMLTGSAYTLWAANHVTPYRDAEGHIDWTRTRRVRLLEIRGA